MFNILLDKYPTEYEGHPINGDFRVGLQIFEASNDDDLSDYEKLEVCASLLFKEAVDAETAGEGIKWFLNGWCHDKHKSSSSDNVMDFDVDQGRIYSAFLSQYRIDLNCTDMHFWKFMYLLTNLEECMFTRVIDIRSKKLTSKMSAEEREMYAEAKKTYRITKETEQTQEDKLAEEEAVAEFRKMAGL